MVRLADFTEQELRTLSKGMNAYKRLVSGESKWDVSRILPEHSTIVCDVDNCDFSVNDTFDHWPKYYNAPCPKCGENLLTKEDTIRAFNMYLGMDAANRFFNWLMPKLPYWLAMLFYSKNTKEVRVSLHEKVTITEVGKD